MLIFFPGKKWGIKTLINYFPTFWGTGLQGVGRRYYVIPFGKITTESGMRLGTFHLPEPFDRSINTTA